MSILCSIWLLVSILGAGPEMFKKLGKSDQHIRLLVKFPSSPLIKVFTWVPPVASVASQCLNQEVTGLQSCVGECFLSFQRDTAISADLGKLALPLNYPPGKTGPDIGHHLSDQSVLEICQQCTDTILSECGLQQVKGWIFVIHLSSEQIRWESKDRVKKVKQVVRVAHSHLRLDQRLRMVCFQTFWETPNKSVSEFWPWWVSM